MLGLVFVVLIATLLYIYTKRTLTYWQTRNVYTERPYPIFGNIAFGKEGMGYTFKRIYETLDEKYKYFGVYILHKPVLVIKDIDLIKKILIKDFSSFANRANYSNEKVDPIASNNLFSLRNEIWRNVRNKMTPVFTSGKMKLMLPLMKNVADKLGDVLETSNNQNIDIKDLTKRFTIDVTTTCAFGFDSCTLKEENSEIKIMTDKLLNPVGFVRRFATFCWILCPFMIDILRLPFIDPEASKYLVDLFRHTEEERRKQNIKRNDLVDLMIELADQEPKNDIFKFDNDKKSAQAIVFYNAGSEANSTLTSLCLYELALNPGIQEKLRNEIKENLDSTGDIPYEALHGMEYLDLVAKETLRKYPFVQFLSRYAEKDYVIESTGLKVEKGTQVIIPTIALHSDPQYYPEPSKFDPERFRGDKVKDLQCAYLPFGEGPRKCIGERFALMSMKLGITTILKDFEVLPGDKTDIPLKFVKNAFFISTRDGKISLKIRKIAT